MADFELPAGFELYPEAPTAPRAARSPAAAFALPDGFDLVDDASFPSVGPVPPRRPANLDTGANVAESAATLDAQQGQLTSGSRPAQMFPLGTDELPLPDGMQRLRTKRGTFHYDPAQTTPEHIRMLSLQGRENEILGLGPVSKPEADALVQAGQQPVVTTERMPDGTEVKAAAGASSTADAQRAALEATKTPGNVVQVESPESVLSKRFPANPPLPPRRPSNLDQPPAPDAALLPAQAHDVDPSAMDRKPTNADGTPFGMLSPNQSQQELQDRIAGAKQTMTEANQRLLAAEQTAAKLQGQPAPRRGSPAMLQKLAIEQEVASARAAYESARQGVTSAESTPAPSQSATRDFLETAFRAPLEQVASATRGIARPIDAVLDTHIAEASQAESNRLEKMFPGDPVRQEEFAHQMAQAFGSSVGFVATGAAGRAVGMSAGVASGAAGFLSQADDYYKDAEKLGQKGWTKWRAYLVGGAIGSSEGFLGLGKIADVLEKQTGGGLSRWLGLVLKEGGEEAVQEATQQLADNLAQYGLFGKDAGDITKDVANNAMIGATLGAMMAGVLGAPGALRTRTRPGERPTLLPSTTAAAPALSQELGDVAQPEATAPAAAQPSAIAPPASSSPAAAPTVAPEPAAVAPLPAAAASTAPEVVPPDASADESALLSAAGFSPEDIADMSPRERAAEVESARAEGIEAPASVAKGPEQSKDAGQSDGFRPVPEHLVTDRVLPLDHVLKHGDGHQSPFILADGRIVATNGDHMSFAGDLHGAVHGDHAPGVSIETTMADHGLVRANYGPTTQGGHTLSVEIAQDQKLTPKQAKVLRQLARKKAPGQPVENTIFADVGIWGGEKKAFSGTPRDFDGWLAEHSQQPAAGTRSAPVTVEQPTDVQAARDQVAEPTPAQAEAGNYRKGHVKYDGLDVTIENPKGSVRRGTDPNGAAWESTLPADYGYVKGTKGADGDHVDVYMGDQGPTGKAFVVDQADPATGKFDEHKIVLGVSSADEAARLYSQAFSDQSGAGRIGAITELSTADLKTWLNDGPKDKPFHQPTAPVELPDGFELASPAANSSANYSKKYSDPLQPTAAAAQPRKHKAREPGPVSLIRYLQMEGGIKDQGGELSARNFHRRYPGLVNNKSGKTLDQARESAAEAGYLPPASTDEWDTYIDAAMGSTTINDFLDALDRHPRYSVEDQDRVAIRDATARGKEYAAEDVDRAHQHIKNELLTQGWTEEDVEQRALEIAAKMMANDEIEGGTAVDYYEYGVWRSTSAIPEVRQTETSDANQRDIPWDDWTGPNAALEDPFETPARAVSGDRAQAPEPRQERQGPGEAATVHGAGEKHAAHPQGAADRGDAAPRKESEGAGPAVEAGAEGKPQSVIPGAEKISDGELAQRKADERLKPKAPQKDAGGLFGEDHLQGDLMDLASKPKEASKPAEAPKADEQEPEDRTHARKEFGGGSWARIVHMLDGTYQADYNVQGQGGGHLAVGKDLHELATTGRKQLDWYLKGSTPDPKKATVRKIQDWLGEQASAKAETPKPLNRSWDRPVSEIEKMSGGNLHPHARRIAILRAWVGQLSDADYRKLTDWGLYDFPRVLSDTMEPGRLLEAFQQSLKEGRAVHIDEGAYTATLDRTADNLLAKKPADKKPTEGVDHSSAIETAINKIEEAIEAKDRPGVKAAADAARAVLESIPASEKAAEGNYFDQFPALISKMEKPGYVTATQQAGAEAKPEAKPAAKAKPVSMFDRLANYFRAGRVVKGYSGFDKVLAFNGTSREAWSVRVIKTDAKGVPEKGAQERTHQTMPSERDLRAWEKENPVATAPAASPVAIAKPAGATPSPFDPKASVAHAVAHHLFTGNGFSTINAARKFVKENGGATLNPKQMEEAVEHGVVKAARAIVDRGASADATYLDLVALYANQPNLATRTSTSVLMQAYSTPAPLAYIASQRAGITSKSSVLEPTAGNGMLLIGASQAKTFANELSPERAQALTEQGFDTHQRDAVTLSFAPEYDAVIANPPFGTVKDDIGETTRFDLSDIQPGYVTGEIDHAIALRALAGMKKDGKAVLILGGINKLAQTDDARSKGYSGKAKREFYLTLYSRYNVVDHFTAAGELYQKQGAGYPVDVIVIDGRGKSSRKLPAVDVPRVFKTWDELKETLNGASPVTATARMGGEGSDRGSAGVTVGPAFPYGTGLRAGADSVAAEQGRVPVSDTGEGRVAGGLREAGPAGEPAVPVAVAAADRDAGSSDRRDVAGGPDPETAPKPRQRVAKQEQETEGQVAYRPHSERAQGLGTLVPKNMQTATADAMDSVADRRGGTDAFVAKALGLKLDEIGKYFSAEQVDALALALDNFEKNSGFIIGDQTGIGKGRVVAGVIRYALKKGLTPIFVTEKPGLYADMYRDLTDIGIQDFLGREPQIVMTNADEKVPVDDEETVVLKGAAAGIQNAILERIARDGKLTDHDMLFTTYNQMQTQKGEATARQSVLRSLAPNAVIIFDEAHNAGGAGPSMIAKKAGEAANRAELARELVDMAKAVFYSSATYAKRPEVMDLYSKTDMQKAVADPTMLGETIARGGVPMQQVVASMLARSGQYVRRERSFAGVTYDAPVVPVDRQVYENFSKALAAVQKFSEAMEPALKRISSALKEEAKGISADGSTGGAGAASTNFTAVMHNLVNQMLLAMKAPVAAERAIAAIKRGEKPVITVANTMGSFLTEFATEGDVRPGDAISIGFADLLARYLERTRTVTLKRPFMKKGEKGEKKYLSDAELGAVGLAAYKQAQKIITGSDFSDLPISPIDYIKDQIERAGFKIGEITGRNAMLDYSGVGEQPKGSNSPSGSPRYQTRPAAELKTRGRRKTISGFNDGSLDAVILNQAGATGLSLHASEKFKDQRKRRMILAQPEGNIDTHMQMLGRVHRTGQVVLPSYDQLVADVPAEKRPAAVLAKKMASLNASTTASRKGALTAEDVPDFMNEYGDAVASEVMAENPDIHRALGSPLGAMEEVVVDAMRKVTGRIPLLPVAKQEQIYATLEKAYKDLLAQKDAEGENALEAKLLDLDAKVISRTVVVEGDGKSPFTESVVLETVDVKRQAKPYTGTDMLSDLSKAVGLPSIVPTNPGSMVMLEHNAAEANRKQVASALDDFRAFSKEMLADIEKEATRRSTQERLDDNHARFVSLMGELHAGRSVVLKSDEQNFPGIVIDVHATGDAQNPIALGSWKVKIAIAGRGVITFPLSRLHAGAGKPAKEDMLRVESQPLNLKTAADQFDLLGAEAREKRIIVTGNLLGGYDYMGRRGQITNYTDAEGNVRQGILLPASVKSAAEVQASKGTALKTADEVLAYLATLGKGRTALKSKDEAVSLMRMVNDDLAVSVPSSKADGGKYFLNRDVMRILVGSEFSKRGATMRTDVYGATESQLVAALMKAGAVFETRPAAQSQEKVTSRAQAAGGFMLTSRAQAAQEDIERVVREVVSRVAGPHVFVRPHNARSISGQGAAGLSASDEATGMYRSIDDGAFQLIDLALGWKDPTNSAHHESWHVLQDLGLQTEQETAVLRADAGRMRAVARRAYPNKTEYVESLPQVELEALAYGFWAAARDRGEEVHGLHIGTRRWFARIADVFTKVRNALRGLGFTNAEEIFERARSGEMKTRERGETRFNTADDWAMRMPTMNDVSDSVREKGRDALEYTADRMVRLKDIQAEIESNSGGMGAVPNAYRTETLSYGRMNEGIEDLWKERVLPLQRQMRQEGITSRELHLYLYARHAQERNDVIASRNPNDPAFADGGSGMMTADAHQILTNVQLSGKQQAYDSLASKIDHLLVEDMDRRVAAGLMSQAEADSWDQQYANYVPLRGFEGDEDTDQRGSGKGYSVRGRESKSALGRHTRADNVVANVVNKSVEGIMRVEKNRVAKSILRLARADEASGNPTGVFKVLKAAPRRRVLDPKSGTVVEVADHSYKNDPDVLVAKVGGKEVPIRINDANLASAVKDLFTHDPDSALRFLTGATRLYAQLRTVLNPFFAPKNFARDITDASIKARGDEGVRRFVKHLPRSIAEATRYVWTGSESPDFNAFRLSGGKVTYAQVRTLEQIRARFELAFKSRLHPANVWHAIKLPLEHWNDMFETGVRYAMWKSARESGKGLDASASAALESTLNFYRRGAGKLVAALSATHPFINASIQSPVRAGRLFRTAKGARNVYLGLVPLGFVIGALNYMVGGDDDDGMPFYDKQPAYDRESNLIVYTGQRDRFGRPNALKMPAFPEVMLPYVMGQSIAAAIFGKRSLGSLMGEVAKAAYALSPTSGRGIVPSIFSWANDIRANKDWKDSPIHLEAQFGKKGIPNSESKFTGTDQNWQALARMLGSLGGGSRTEKPVGVLDLHPEDVRHIAKELGGSWYNVIAFGKAMAGFSGGDVDTRSPPIVRDFTVQGSSHEGYERQAFEKGAGKANGERTLLTDTFDPKAGNANERRAQRAGKSRDIQSAGGVVGPKGGLTTATSEIYNTGRTHVGALYKQLDANSADASKSPASKVADAETIRFQIAQTRKKYRLMAEGVEAGRLKFGNVQNELGRTRALLRRDPLGRNL